MKKAKKLPQIYALFIIGALLPQILGFNGSLFDTFFKLCLIGLLLLLLFEKNAIRYFDFYGVTYLALLIASYSLTFLGSNDSIGTFLENLIISILLVYLLYRCPQNSSGLQVEDCLHFYSTYVYFILVACLYNMVIHYNSLLHIMNLSVYGGSNICSFFDNKNTFGVFLMFGVLGATILKTITKQKRWLVIILICILNELMAMCRTAIVLSVGLFIVGILIDKTHRKRNAFLLIFGISIAIFIINTNSVIGQYFTRTLFGSTQSLDARNDYIQEMLPLIHGQYALWGYGDIQASRLAATVTGNKYYHNTYLKLLISGGVLRLWLYIMALALAVRSGMNVFWHHVKIGGLCLLSIVVYIVYSCVEAVILFDTPVVAMVATIFTISMPILFCHTETGEELQ